MHSLLERKRREFTTWSMVAMFLAILSMVIHTPKAWAAIEIEEELASIPEACRTAEGFIPLNWQLDKKVVGDLNKDGLEDLVLLITRRESQSCFAEDMAKAVVVAFQDKNLGFRQVALNTGIARLDCSLMSDIVVMIENGKIHIENCWGSREIVTEHFLFRYSSKREAFELIGYDRYQCDSLTMNGREESHNLITGDKVFELIVNGNVVSSKRSSEDKKPLKLFGGVVATETD